MTEVHAAFARVFIEEDRCFFVCDFDLHFLEKFFPSWYVDWVILICVDQGKCIHKCKFQVFREKALNQSYCSVENISQMPQPLNKLSVSHPWGLHLQMRLYLYIAERNNSFHLTFCLSYVLFVPRMHSNQPLFISDVPLLFELLINLPSTLHPQGFIIQKFMISQLVSQLYLCNWNLRRIAVKVIRYLLGMPFLISALICICS